MKGSKLGHTGSRALSKGMAIKPSVAARTHTPLQSNRPVAEQLTVARVSAPRYSSRRATSADLSLLTGCSALIDTARGGSGESGGRS